MPDPAPGRGRKAAFALVLLAAIGVLGIWLAVTTLFGGQFQSFGSVWRSVIIAILIPAVIAGLIGLMVSDRRRLAALRERRPESHVFISRRSRELRELLGAAGMPRRLAGSFGVAITDDAVELWRSRRDETAAITVPWTELTGGRVGTAHIDGAPRATESPAVILSTGERSGSAEIPILVDRRAGGAGAVLAEIQRRRAGYLERAIR